MYGRDDRGQLRQEGVGRSRFVTLLAVIGALVVASMLINRSLFDLPGIPDWFGGGESDPAPRGTVEYKGQQATAASEDFLVDIGDGEATISVRARQKWDTPGGVFSGDFVSTNGTSSVADPEDRDKPAALKVKVDYCADGLITSYDAVDPDEGEPARQIRFEMGDLWVCNTTLEHTRQNDAAFRQSDTPNIFHGEFVSFVARATEWTAAAAECPAEELAEFQSDEALDHIRSQLAGQYGLPESAVEVVEGKPGQTDERTQRSLRNRLESYANAEDPDNPSKSFEALDIQYLSGDGEAVADSCYKDPGRRSLDDLSSVEAPKPTEDDEKS
jgi:hypothetical protein